MIGASISSVTPWVALVFIAYFVRGTVMALAGRHTFADIGLRFAGDFRVSESIAYIFGIGGLGYGIRMKKLHGDNVQRTASRIAELESRLDPKRSSSRLTPRGETRPEDRL